MARSSTKAGKRSGRGSNEVDGQIDEAQRKVSVAAKLPPNSVPEIEIGRPKR
jgi:hypothetical protein